MRAMSQITVEGKPAMEIAAYIKSHLPPGCQMKCFQDLATKQEEWTIFIYGEMKSFWELEGLMIKLQRVRGVIFAFMI